jgi:hypothetical protein
MACAVMAWLIPMAATRLYIIGNGFDLRHGIPSAYGNFKSFVRDLDSQVFRTVEKYLPAGQEWWDLESALARIDVDYLIDDLAQFMPGYSADDWSDAGHHDFQYEMGRVTEGLSTELRARFGQWIRQLPIPSAATAPGRLRSLDPAAPFFNFNYTSTLRTVYGVPDENVLHIHGRADLPDSELVLGHGWNPVERRSLNDRADIEDLDTRLVEGQEILDRYFSETFKPSARLIEQNHSFFDRLLGVEEVCLLGHSIQGVDWPYYRRLLAIPAMGSASWRVACVEDEDWDEKASRLKELGVAFKNIVTCSWSEL